jgi:hypothetical protein
LSAQPPEITFCTIGIELPGDLVGDRIRFFSSLACFKSLISANRRQNRVKSQPNANAASSLLPPFGKLNLPLAALTQYASYRSNLATPTSGNV